MSKVSIDKKVPAFSLSATDDKTVTLDHLQGKNIVLYFYPKDSTPGCTREGKDFRDKHAEFEKANTVILGVSRDSIQSHENFKAKQNFNFDLLSDEDETLCKMFDIYKTGIMGLKKARGIKRSTFLIDADGVLRKEWRSVKVDGHVDEVLDAVKALNNNQ